MHFDTDQLRDYRFGLLEEQETARIAAHLETCADCRAELDAIDRQFAVLDLLKDQPAVSDQVVAAVLHATPSRKIIPFRTAAILAAAASIAIVFGIIQGRDGSSNGPGREIADSSVYSVSSVVNPPQPTLAQLRAEKPFAPASNIELNVLPRRDDVQLTIYNAEDLTLVRETRKLTLKRGWNWLQFMWSNTLIDPTSLSLEPKTHADQIEITQLVYPPRLNDLARWTIFSEFGGEADFELTYFTSGLKWNAFYEATLAPDEQQMRLKAYVRVDNGSGEDYENAETRLVVGTINLEDQIADLASRLHAYGSPVITHDTLGTIFDGGDFDIVFKDDEANNWARVYDFGRSDIAEEDDRDVYFFQTKEILKQALSEYQLYTIEGRETIPDQWGKRLPSFDVQEIGVTNLYKYNEERWGDATMRFLSFSNTEACELGETPLPEGVVRVFGNTATENRLTYVGASSIKYIPLGEVVELELGAAQKVTVEPKLMATRTDNFEFLDGVPTNPEWQSGPVNGDITGWDEITNWKIEITNTRDLPVEVEITRATGSTDWEVRTDDPYEKYDAEHLRFTVRLEPRSKKEINYELTVPYGTRSDD